jgi:hypothetical protein
VFQKQKNLVQTKLSEYRANMLHLQKPNIVDRNKLIIFNDLVQDTTKDWEWSVFDSNYINNEEVPSESNIIIAFLYF